MMPNRLKVTMDQKDQKLRLLTTILHHFLHMFLASSLLLLASIPACLLHLLRSLPTSYTFLLAPLDPHFLLLTLGLGLVTYGIFTNAKAFLLPLLLWNLQSVIPGIFTTVFSQDLILAVSLVVQLLLLLMLISCLVLMETCQHSYRDQLESAESCQHSYRDQLESVDDRDQSEPEVAAVLKDTNGVSAEKLEV